MKNKLLTSFLLTAMLVGLASSAMASTTWYVNGMSGSDSNACTSATDACQTIGHAISLASSGDSIMVAAATYNENITISFSLKILGANASTTIIDPAGNGMVVNVSSPSAQVTVSQLTLRNGIGITNSGTLTVNHTTVAHNIRGISNSGTLTMNDSIVSANREVFDGVGGGIENSGTLTINNSSVRGNTSAGNGGGVFNTGILKVIDSTINDNYANEGCSIGVLGKKRCYSGSGGGIYNGSGTVAITNSTLTGNSAKGGGSAIYVYSGVVMLSNGTVSGNTSSLGGIYNLFGTATFQNTIVANTSGGNCSGTITSNGYNLSSDNTCNFNGPGDLNNTEPLLGELGSHGGPTQTIPEPLGSPTVDAGNPNGCTDSQGHLLKTDQRGYPRPGKYKTDNRCDMGAYERQSD